MCDVCRVKCKCVRVWEWESARHASWETGQRGGLRHCWFPAGHSTAEMAEEIRPMCRGVASSQTHSRRPSARPASHSASQPVTQSLPLFPSIGSSTGISVPNPIPFLSQWTLTAPQPPHLLNPKLTLPSHLDSHQPLPRHQLLRPRRPRLSPRSSLRSPQRPRPTRHATCVYWTDEAGDCGEAGGETVGGE